jgi:tRNA nucleotidyltransferase (CCA-adding enzyme)
MKSIFILHEGNERKTADNEMIRLLMEDLGLNLDLVDFRGMGAKSNFFKDDKYGLLIQAVRTNQVDKILFVIDADDAQNDAKYGGFENTQSELQKMIALLGFEDISEIFVACDPSSQTGYLESLILSTIPETEKNCIEQFLQCSNFKSKENHKAILNQIYKMAYPKAPYNFSHANFDPLKAALQQLFAC